VISINDAVAVEGSAAMRYIDDFVAANSGGLQSSRAVVFGPDGYLYVASALPPNLGGEVNNQVLRYDAQTGAFVDVAFVSGDSGVHFDGNWAMTFGPDNKLYVGGRRSDNVIRYDPITDIVEEFIPAGGRVYAPAGLAFGPDGNLYVSNSDKGTTDTSSLQDQVVRYQGPESGTPGQFIDVFIARGDNGLNNNNGLVFQGSSLYVCNTRGDSIYRYNSTTGAFQGVFVAPNSGGLDIPSSLLFRDNFLYVTSQGTAQVLRYDASTGTFIDAPVGAGSYTNGDGAAGIAFDATGNLYIGFNHVDVSGTPTLSKVVRYGPASQAAFTVRLDAPVATPVSVQFATADGTAFAGIDYTATSGAITFQPGETSRTIFVHTLDDALGEASESLVINLSDSVGATIVDSQGVGTILDKTRFYVVDDGAADRTYEYGTTGLATENYALNTANTASRGAASTAAGTTVWVVDANKTVYVYDASGSLLGSWTAGGMNAAAQVEGITTDGSDIWLVDAKQDKVFRYTNAANRFTGIQNAASSFSLNSANKNPKDLVTDGTSIWVVDDASTDKVFKYSLSGSLLGSWTLSGGGGSPTGITLDPTGGQQHLWVVDNATDRVYQYDNARSRTSGSQAASVTSTFQLAAGNTNPQGIADPPSPADRIDDGLIDAIRVVPAESGIEIREGGESPAGRTVPIAHPTAATTRISPRPAMAGGWADLTWLQGAAKRKSSLLADWLATGADL